jgi:hypothetical protein
MLLRTREDRGVESRVEEEDKETNREKEVEGCFYASF